jgi:hypothetical protein
LAGGSYPTAVWQPGEVVRGEFDLPYDGSRDRPSLEIGGKQMDLRPMP